MNFENLCLHFCCDNSEVGYGLAKFCTCVVAMEEIFALFVVSLQRFFSRKEVVEVVKCLCLLNITRCALKKSVNSPCLHPVSHPLTPLLVVSVK
jgi:hypothetical protein